MSLTGCIRPAYTVFSLREKAVYAVFARSPVGYERRRRQRKGVAPTVCSHQDWICIDRAVICPVHVLMCTERTMVFSRLVLFFLLSPPVDSFLSTDAVRCLPDDPAVIFIPKQEVVSGLIFYLCKQQVIYLYYI